VALFCLAAAARIPTTSRAEEPADEWEGRITLSGWLPAIDGPTQLPTGKSASSIEVDASSILGILKFTVMGTFAARQRRWGGWTDALYVHVGGDSSGSRDLRIGGRDVPGDVDVKASLDIESWIVTAAGANLLGRTPRSETELPACIRMISVGQTLDRSVDGNIGQIEMPGRGGSASVGATNGDGILGRRGMATAGASPGDLIRAAARGTPGGRTGRIAADEPAAGLRLARKRLALARRQLRADRERCDLP
jgi:hypothetical protein